MADTEIALLGWGGPKEVEGAVLEMHTWRVQTKKPEAKLRA